jgi:hypothetical protein
MPKAPEDSLAGHQLQYEPRVELNGGFLDGDIVPKSTGIGDTVADGATEPFACDSDPF